MKELAANPDVSPDALNNTARTLSLLVGTQYRIAPNRHFRNPEEAAQSNYYTHIPKPFIPSPESPMSVLSRLFPEKTINNPHVPT